MATQYNRWVCTLAGASLSAWLGGSAAQAQDFDFTVDFEGTVTNGDPSHILDGGDSLTITPEGAIRVEGVNTSVFGTQDVSGTDNRVHNQGTIEATLTGEGGGFAVSGMLSNQDNHLAINDGTITVLETLSEWPGAGGGFALTQAFGIANSEATSTTINNGLVSVDSFANATTSNALGGSYGIIGRGNLTNTGTVIVHARASSEEDFAATQVIGLFNTAFSSSPRTSVVTNSGEICATVESYSPTNASAVAVGLSAQNEIRNSGKITVGGWANGVAADPNDLNHVIAAIEANFGDFAVYLDAPSYFGGQLLLEHVNSAGVKSVHPVTITTGASHSILWDLQNTDTTLLTVVDGLLPAFSDTGDWTTATKIATFDPTVFAARSSALADRAGEVGGLMRSRREAATDPCGPGGNSADLSPNTYKEPVIGCTAEAGFTAWIGGFGRKMDYDGSEPILDYTTKTYGGAGGFEWINGNGLTLGAMLGYGAETLDTASLWTTSYDNDAGGFFAGAYGRKQAGVVIVDFDIAGGYLDHDDDRFVNDNLAWDATGFFDGASWRSASYDSWWASVGAALSADIALGGAWTLTPRVGGFYAYEWIDGYSESGGAASATVGSQHVGVAEGHLELALSRVVGSTRITGRGGYFARTSTGDDHVDVTVYGMKRSVPTYADDASGFYAGGDFVVDLPGSAVIAIGGNAFFGDDVTGYEGNASLGFQF